MRLIFPCLLACAAAVAPALSQVPADRLAACEMEPGAPLLGTVRDAETGEPLRFATIEVAGEDVEWADEQGCYSSWIDDVCPIRRIRASMHRYVTLDTTVAARPGASDTLHLALRPAPPGCCRLEGEWSIHLVLDTASAMHPKPRTREVAGRIVFDPRLASDVFPQVEDPRQENGRFDIDLAPFFGGPFASDVSTTIATAMTDDFLTRAAGEVFAWDSVEVVLIPGMSHGGLSLFGTLRGDTVQGEWYQNAYCCGAQGRFRMHRVPRTPAGDSLVSRGVRSMEAERARAAQAQAARARRVGRLRLRVWDEGTGRYSAVSFAADGHEDNPGGGTTSLAYRSGADGWGPGHELEPGRYDLLVYEYACEGEQRMADEDFVRRELPRITVTIQPGERVDQDIRLDLCAIEPRDLDHETVVPLVHPGR